MKGKRLIIHILIVLVMMIHASGGTDLIARLLILAICFAILMVNVFMAEEKN